MILCESKTAQSMPRWMRVGIFAGGLLLLGGVVRSLILGATGGMELQRGLIGLFCLLAAGYKKRIYLSPEGIVKETKNWTGRYREVFLWKDVRHVTLVFRGNGLMCFFEKDMKGWRLLFDASQERVVRDILSTHIPKTDVEVMHKL